MMWPYGYGGGWGWMIGGWIMMVVFWGAGELKTEQVRGDEAKRGVAGRGDTLE